MFSFDHLISNEEITQLLIDIDSNIHLDQCTNDSLTAGSLGIVTYYHYRHIVYKNEKDKQKFISLLEQIFYRINRGKSSLLNGSLARGLCGFTSVLSYIYENCENDSIISKQEITYLDNFLFIKAKEMILNGENDFLYGSIGIINYFLSRNKEPYLDNYLNELIDLQLKSITKTNNGSFIQNSVFEKNDLDKIDFGLSHGQTSFLLTLIKNINAGIKIEECKKILKTGLDFLLFHKAKNKRNIVNYSYFPIYVTKNQSNSTFSSRFGWCYGDLNEVYVLYKAAMVLENPTYNEIADCVGLNSINRISFTETLCNSSQFCHGSAGLAEFYKSLYQIRPIESYYKSYHYWINQTVYLLNKERQINHSSSTNIQLLEGQIGAAITLLSYISNKNSPCKHLFLLD